MKTQLKKHTIKQKNMGGEGGSAGIAKESKSAGGRKGKGRNEKPRIARRDKKKNREISVQVRTCKSCICKGRKKKSHKVHITTGIPRLLSCTEEDKTFHTISELSGD